MVVPPQLLKLIKGECLAVTSQASGDVSVLGTKTVVLTDHPALYLHDTGGAFGREQTLQLEKLSPPRADLKFAAGGSALRGSSSSAPTSG